MTQLKKALIRVDWYGRKPEDIEVQYNPTEYSLDKQAQFGEIDVPGLDSPLQQFVRGQTEKLSMELFFDTTDLGMGAGATSVTTETDKIYQLIKIEPKRHAPPLLTFIWADQFPGSSIGGAPGAGASAVTRAIGGAAEAVASAAGAALGAAGAAAASAMSAIGAPLGGQRRNGLRCVMESVKQKFTLFSPEGVPLRATLTITLREYKTLTEQLNHLQLSSPDRTHVHVLQQGDSLASVSTQYYDQPALWREVANANGIDDARRLSSGRFLRVPRLNP
ncbi:LysM peptidoglycan-binding domain-containing protein [Variovorax sp. J22R24]|uniref:CIS tube protein n=1 Tax=Variovorax gracilis TaxID=3053502 RepID=UPI002574E26B|nr:LysM peptidoglycan-binding domain-containing protein [Variovorax sp. J22R24]MDM0109625.1 LysM peptidoglycan-binding domain-containing protein [Variovorax sp. J22R24]